MNKICFLTILLYINNIAVADDSIALSKLGQAVSKTESFKARARAIENRIVDILPVDKEVAGTLGGLTVYAAQGRIGTRDIKNMNMDFFGGLLRADFEYDFKSDATEGFIRCQWQL
jgi:hypothetical protein